MLCPGSMRLVCVGERTDCKRLPRMPDRCQWCLRDGPGDLIPWTAVLPRTDGICYTGCQFTSLSATWKSHLLWKNINVLVCLFNCFRSRLLVHQSIKHSKGQKGKHEILLFHGQQTGRELLMRTTATRETSRSKGWEEEWFCRPFMGFCQRSVNVNRAIVCVSVCLSV